MTLEFTLDKTGYGKLSEDVQSLYKVNGDNYQLNVKGAVSKTKLDEFRDNNILKDKEFKALEKKFSGVDLDQYAEFKLTQQKLDDKKLIDAGDIDALVASKVAVVSSDLEAKNATERDRGDSYKAKYENEVRESKIQGATATAFTENKISPTFHKSLSSQINSTFTIKDGSVVAMDGDKIMTGKNGNLTINEFVQSQDDAFKISSSGGNGSGGGGGGGGDRSTNDKVQSGLAKLTK